MKTQQFILKPESDLDTSLFSLIQPQFCLVFGNRIQMEKNTSYVETIRKKYPSCAVISVSTAGTILNTEVLDNEYSVTFVELEKSSCEAILRVHGYSDDSQFGRLLAQEINPGKLRYVLLLGTSGMNAERVLHGVNEVIGNSVSVSGGIAGDDTRFEKTIVGLNGDFINKGMLALCFYGDQIKVGHGTKGGWTPLGTVRKITKATGNVVFEIDGKPALQLYKEYLGAKSSELPGSALLFPLAIINSTTEEMIVRTVQTVNEDNKSISFFGDFNEGDNVQFVNGHFDDLLWGSGRAAAEALSHLDGNSPELALLISCVARRLVLGQRTEEELDEARNALGPHTTMCGFYSYSELSPLVGSDACHLHNQTMTITTLSEK